MWVKDGRTRLIIHLRRGLARMRSSIYVVFGYENNALFYHSQTLVEMTKLRVDHSYSFLHGMWEKTKKNKELEKIINRAK